MCLAIFWARYTVLTKVRRFSVSTFCRERSLLQFGLSSTQQFFFFWIAHETVHPSINLGIHPSILVTSLFLLTSPGSVSTHPDCIGWNAEWKAWTGWQRITELSDRQSHPHLEQFRVSLIAWSSHGWTVGICLDCFKQRENAYSTQKGQAQQYWSCTNTTCDSTKKTVASVWWVLCGLQISICSTVVSFMAHACQSLSLFEQEILLRFCLWNRQSITATIYVS